MNIRQTIDYVRTPCWAEGYIVVQQPVPSGYEQRYQLIIPKNPEKECDCENCSLCCPLREDGRKETKFFSNWEAADNYLLENFDNTVPEEDIVTYLSRDCVTFLLHFMWEGCLIDNWCEFYAIPRWVSYEIERPKNGEKNLRVRFYLKDDIEPDWNLSEFWKSIVNRTFPFIPD